VADVSQPIRDRSATVMQPNRNRPAAIRNDPPRQARRCPQPPGQAAPRHEARTSRSRRINDFSGKLTVQAAKRRVFLPGIGHDRAHKTPASWLSNTLSDN
jgi:hypothetical protein